MPLLYFIDDGKEKGGNTDRETNWIKYLQVL